MSSATYDFFSTSNLIDIKNCHVTPMIFFKQMIVRYLEVKSSAIYEQFFKIYR